MTQTPPGHYAPERKSSTKVSGYSFGMRTKRFTHDSTPAPNNYDIPSSVGSGAGGLDRSFWAQNFTH